MPRRPIELSSTQAVAARLVLLRAISGLTQGKMSELCGAIATGQTWQQYEAGRRMIAIHHAIALCVRFRVTLDWIYRGEFYGLPPDLTEKLQLDPRTLPDNLKDRRRRR